MARGLQHGVRHVVLPALARQLRQLQVELQQVGARRGLRLGPCAVPGVRHAAQHMLRLRELAVAEQDLEMRAERKPCRWRGGTGQKCRVKAQGEHRACLLAEGRCVAAVPVCGACFSNTRGALCACALFGSEQDGPGSCEARSARPSFMKICCPRNTLTSSCCVASMRMSARSYTTSAPSKQRGGYKRGAHPFQRRGEQAPSLTPPSPVVPKRGRGERAWWVAAEGTLVDAVERVLAQHEGWMG